MLTRDEALGGLKLAEHQFRLACTVHLAVANGVQTLDVPVEWTFGRHRVLYEDFGLRKDQADWAAAQLENTATFVVASAVRDAICVMFANPKAHQNPDVVSAYQISRMLRNAFSHSMLFPKWSIDPDCAKRTFAIGEIISLDTTNLNDTYVKWQDYRGPLAIFHFGRFVREELLGDKVDPNRRKPDYPTVKNYQQGRLILRQIDTLPPDAMMVASAGPDEKLHLGDGHYVIVAPESDP
jgi:hypothetical protein